MTPESVNEIIGGFADFFLSYALTLAAVGALSMALIEALKSLFSWRDRWHRWKVCEWVEGVPPPLHLLEQLGAKLLNNEEEFHRRVYSQLILLTTGQHVESGALDKGGIELLPWSLSQSNALFALDLEKMMGQIQDAADMALGNPDHYLELYLFLTDGGDNNDITNWYEWANTPPMPMQEDPLLAKKQADTYSRIRQFIRSRLDAFQLATNYRWQTLNQVVSVSLGSVLLFAALVSSSEHPNWIGFIIISLVGGMMAPVAKDLVVALKRVRSGG